MFQKSSALIPRFSEDGSRAWLYGFLNPVKSNWVLPASALRTAFKENVDNVLYYSLAYSSSTPYDKLIDVCEDIIHDFKPDIIQIEGTEFPHAKAMLEASDRNGVKAVVSMQGILNGQYAYQCGQLQIDDMMLSHRISDVFSAWILHLRKTKWYKPRMKPEREIIEKARYILG